MSISPMDLCWTPLKCKNITFAVVQQGFHLQHKNNYEVAPVAVRRKRFDLAQVMFGNPNFGHGSTRRKIWTKHWGRFAAENLPLQHAEKPF